MAPGLSKQDMMHLPDTISQPLLMEHHKGGSVISAISILSKTIIGVGLLGLPCAFYNVGMGLGVVMLLISGMMTLFTLHLLSCIAIKVGSDDVSFYQVAGLTYPSLAYLIDGAIFAKCIGVGISYLIVLGDAATDVFPFTPEAMGVSRDTLRAILIVASVVCLVAPASFPKKMKSLAFTNWIALACMIYVAILIFATFLYNYSNGAHATLVPENVQWYTTDVTKIVQSLPIFIFAFTCHQNMFTISNEIGGRSIEKLDLVALSSVIISLTLYYLSAFGGLFEFGSEVKSDILTNYGTSSMLFYIAKAGIAISMIFSFPLQAHPARRSLWLMCFGESPMPKPRERFIRNMFTTGILLSTTAVACSTHKLGLVFQLVGAVGSNSICLILPTLLYIKFFESDGWTTKRTAAACVLALGCVILPTCLYMVLFAGSGH